MAVFSPLEILRSKLYTHHVIPRTAYAGSWKTRLGKLFSLEIPSSMEVSCAQPSPIIRMMQSLIFDVLGCGRFFEGTAEEMHTALNKALSSLPSDTKVYVGQDPSRYESNGSDGNSQVTNIQKPMSSSGFRSCGVNL